MKSISFTRDGLCPPALQKNSKLREFLTDALFFLAGSTIYSVSVEVFTAPNKIAPGGITGIATVLHYLFGTSIGIMFFILNIPLFLLGFRLIGSHFIVKTVICTALVSVIADLMEFFNIYTYHGNLLLASLYGGVLSGAGLGLIFLRGGTTGGTDVASRLFKLKYKHIPMGRMMMFIDFVVVTFAAVVFRSIDGALYALITIFTCSRVVDGILYGADTGRMVLIISDKEQEIAQNILHQLNRGVTVFKGRGYYTGRERDILMCAVRRPEAATLRTLVRKTDPTAFIIMCEAGEVIGEGFKPITKED